MARTNSDGHPWRELNGETAEIIMMTFAFRYVSYFLYAYSPYSLKMPPVNRNFDSGAERAPHWALEDQGPQEEHYEAVGDVQSYPDESFGCWLHCQEHGGVEAINHCAACKCRHFIFGWFSIQFQPLLRSCSELNGNPSNICPKNFSSHLLVV